MQNENPRAEVAERIVRVMADFAETGSVSGRVVMEDLIDTELADDYRRIKRSEQADAFFSDQLATLFLTDQELEVLGQCVAEKIESLELDVAPGFHTLLNSMRTALAEARYGLLRTDE